MTAARDPDDDRPAAGRWRFDMRQPTRPDVVPRGYLEEARRRARVRREVEAEGREREAGGVEALVARLRVEEGEGRQG